MIGRHEFSNGFPPQIDAFRLRKELALGEIDKQKALAVVKYLIFCREESLVNPNNYSDKDSKNHARKILADLRKLHSELENGVRKINVRGGLKGLAAILLELENAGRIDHVTDLQAAELFTVNGAPVNPDSLKSIRSRDLGTAK